MDTVNQLAERLNRIQWLSPAFITPEAEGIIQEHLRRIRIVISHLRQKGLALGAAHGRAHTAGHQSEEYKRVLDVLFHQVRFWGAQVRYPLIATIGACYGWDHDPELRDFPNPWLPLLELYDLGYTTSFKDAPDGSAVDLLVGYNNGIQAYAV
jgi:hypothetical protein